MYKEKKDQREKKDNRPYTCLPVPARARPARSRPRPRHLPARTLAIAHSHALAHYHILVLQAAQRCASEKCRAQRYVDCVTTSPQIEHDILEHCGPHLCTAAALYLVGDAW